MTNKFRVSDPTIGPPDFNLRRSTWLTLNRFCTGPGRCAADLNEWRVASSGLCRCGRRRTNCDPCGGVLCHVKIWWPGAPL